MKALHNSYFLKEDGLFFSSKALGLVFSAMYLRGSFALSEQEAFRAGSPLHCPDKSGPAVSATDTLRKDSSLTPVTSEKATLFIGVIKIVRFRKALDVRIYFY
jgi:hypothetical protein